MRKTSFGFEFSPPRSEKEQALLPDVIQTLSALNPRLMTVTYGAGGSRKDGTIETLRLFQQFSNCALASHLTHIASTRQELNDYMDLMWENDIKHIVALRGDVPNDVLNARDPNGDYYSHTDEFVAAIAKRHPFGISVAAYPEKHPEARTWEDDILNLKRKCDAGATEALTQFFFDNDYFYRLRDDAAKAGIETPIIPGLMRINSFEGVKRFADKIGTSVPPSLISTFNKAADPVKTAEDILCAQVEDLKRHGVDDFHFYTMNKSHGFNRALDLIAA